MRIISIAHFALLPAGRLLPVLEGRDDLWLAPVSASGSVSKNGRAISLAFDHSEIIAATLERLRSNLNHSDVAFRLLPAEFTLRELQQVHEAILGHSVNKPAFRKRLVDSGLLEATGDRQLGGPFRPAELYRYCGTAQG
jgi:8-oxo-dGTP diphosphatase